MKPDDFTLTPPVPPPAPDPHEIELDERAPWPMPGTHVPNPVVVHKGEPPATLDFGQLGAHMYRNWKPGDPPVEIVRPAEPTRRWWKWLVGR